jgi:hypothetical protein
MVKLEFGHKLDQDRERGANPLLEHGSGGKSIERSICHTTICTSETIAGAKSIRTTRQSNTGEEFRRDCAVRGKMTGEKSNLELESMREVCRNRVSHIPKSSPLKPHAWNCQSC